MKKLVLLLTCTLAALSAHAQNSDYGAVDNFFMANPDLPDHRQYAGRFVNPHYLLINWNQQDEMDQRMTSNGFVRLGVSSWANNNPYGGGVPQRDLAIAYARFIGADVVIYTTKSGYDYDLGAPENDHNVWFYAKQGTTSVRRADPAYQSDDITIAEKHLQAAWDRLPSSKKNQLRPAQRNWIVQKDAASPDRKLQMINQRTAWLLQQG